MITKTEKVALFDNLLKKTKEIKTTDTNSVVHLKWLEFAKHVFSQGFGDKSAEYNGFTKWQSNFNETKPYYNGNPIAIRQLNGRKEKLVFLINQCKTIINEYEQGLAIKIKPAIKNWRIQPSKKQVNGKL